MNSRFLLLLALAMAVRLSGQLEVAANGNVGIGTSTPGSKLTIVGNIKSSTGDIQVDAAHGLIDVSAAASVMFDGNGKITATTQNSQPFVVSGGNVGIGTTAPAAKLDVFSGGSMTAGGYNGQLATLQVGHTGGAAANADGAMIVLSQQYSSGDPASIVRVGAIVGYKGQVDGSFGGGMKFRVQPVGANPLLDVMTLAMSGNVGIGTTTPAHKLEVSGTVRATSFISNTATYADFVFKPDYKLPSLSEVEAHIAEHGTLPGVPSEAQVAKEGIDLAAMQVKLLQKIEEITLHQIAQAKDIVALKTENARLQRQLSTLSLHP